MSHSTQPDFRLSAKKQMLLEALRKQKGLGASPIQQISRREGVGAPRLSYAQERLWFLAQLEPENVAYNNAAAVRLSGPVNLAALEWSVDEIIRRHEVLRTTFAVSDGEPVQVIASELKIPVPVIDLQHCPKENHEDEIDRLARAQIRQPFDLSEGPLLRVLILRLGEREHVLIFTMHHIICDGWSRGVLVRELAAHYAASLDRRKAQLPELPIQYADFAEWQRDWLRGDTLDRQMDYWKKQLGGKLSPLGLLTDRPRPAVETYNGAVTRFTLAKELTRVLNQLSQQNGATLFMTLLAAFDTLLARYTGQEDILVGTPIANRNHSQVEHLIGYFANTIVLRTRANLNLSFGQLLAQVRDVTLEAYAHQDIPFEKLVGELQPDRDMSRNPLFQAMFALQNTPASSLELPQLKITPLEVDSGASVFDLTLLMAEADGMLAGALEYNTDLFDASTAEALARHFQNLLKNIADNPQQALSKLSLLGEAERRQILIGWNATKADFNLDVCIHSLVEEQAARTPNEIAVTFREQRLTYEDLNRKANKLAHYLRKLGVGPEVLVGICVDRSVEMMVGLLAVIKAGGAAIALDPSYPKDRLEFMIRDARGPVLLTQQRLRDSLPDAGVNKICLDSQWPDIERESDDNPLTTVAADNLIYGIYTSGSTGLPKGIGMTHRAFLNLLEWQHRHPSISATAKTVQFATFGFCVSFQEIFSTWCSGGTIALIEDDSRRNMEELADFLKEQRIERLYLPFASLKNLAEVCTSTKELPASLREFITAGEQLQVTDTIRAFFERIDGGVLHNHYGASETHVVSSYTLSGPPREWPDIPPSGRPVSNVQIYLLDPHLQPVPVGIAGEIYIGGVCLARSYFNDAELTAEKFTPDPFGDEPGARLYKTGDLGRYLADGNISYLGRADQQVKIRGFRVEPGEVEVVLRQHPDVLDAAVVPQEDSKGNNKLVAYVVWDTREQVGEVRNFLKSKLPEYMLPAVFVPLASLPMNANGKLDRQALPIVEGLGSQSGENYVAPRNAVEEILAGLWSEVLAVTGVGVNDSFFESGGHSLLATQLVSRVREAFQIDLPLRRLFESPTIASMAGHINAALGAGEIFKAPPIERAPRDKALALSFAQQRLWFFDRLQPGSPLYNVPSALLVKGDLNVTALRQSLNEIVKRHEALRTTFAANGGEPVQTIAQDVYVPLPVVDLTSLREGERDSEAKRLTLEEGQQPFDISRGPLMRAKLLRTNDDTHVLLLTVHHIVFDGWSGRVFVTELGELYNSLSAGEAASLPALGIQYSDFAHWQREWMRGEVLASQLSYWTEQLESLSRLDVPTDFPGREAESFKGARQTFLVAKELAGSLNELSRRKGVTLFMLLLAAFDALLHRYSRQEDIVVGTPIANRNRTEIEGLIGMFVNTLAIRVNLGGNPTFNELLGRVREAALGAYAHQDLPFEKLVEELHLERDARRNPVFQVMFVLHNTPMPPLQLTGLTLSPLDVETGTAKFSLTLSMMESEEGLIGSLEYNTDLFKASTIEHMVCGFETLLESIVSGPDRRVDSLPMLTESESRQLLVEWNQTGREYPREQCINQIFEQQVEHAPDAIAVMFADQRLTYREINERANQLSHHLLSLGAGPESLVAIYLERSVEMIVALLATAKAGAAYVPLDTTYPLERIAFVLEEIQAAIILTQDSLVYELPACWAQIICLDSDRDQVAAQSVENPVNNAAPDNLAYVIYTSGSTGQPKGVCVTHRNVARLVKGNYFADLDSDQVLLQLAPVSFDASTFEVWGSLLNGARLAVMPPEPPTLAQIGKALSGFHVTTLWLTAGLFHLIVDERLEDLKGLRQLLAGGDALSARHVKKALQALDGCAVINGYGPTESTTFACCHRMSSADGLNGSSVPIGRPIANTQVYILDKLLQPLPTGAPGELYIGGDGLARGYINRADLTAEMFVPNPFSPDPGGRLYKTGDLCRYSVEGEIEFLGRSDYQVKIRGYRVEPGEIEAALNQYSGVRESVVIASEKSFGDKRLIAYLVPDEEASFTSVDVQNYLKDKLPDYMIPAQLVALDSLPLTPNGKVDRAALPPPDGLEANLQPVFVAPRTDVEELLAGVWAEVLQVENVSVEDNFFQFGGQSLTAIQVISRVRDLFLIEVPLRCIFEAPTVSRFAEALLEFEESAGQIASIARLRKQVNNMAPGEIHARMNE